MKRRKKTQLSPPQETIEISCQMSWRVTWWYTNGDIILSNFQISLSIQFVMVISSMLLLCTRKQLTIIKFYLLYYVHLKYVMTLTSLQIVKALFNWSLYNYLSFKLIEAKTKFLALFYYTNKKPKIKNWKKKYIKIRVFVVRFCIILLQYYLLINWYYNN